MDDGHLGPGAELATGKPPCRRPLLVAALPHKLQNARSQADPAPGGGYTEGGFQWGFGPNAAPDTDAADLNYSCSLWADQIIAFVESVVKTGPVYIAGNSLGGYLAVMVGTNSELRALNFARYSDVCLGWRSVSAA